MNFNKIRLIYCLIITIPLRAGIAPSTQKDDRCYAIEIKTSLAYLNPTLHVFIKDFATWDSNDQSKLEVFPTGFLIRGRLPEMDQKYRPCLIKWLDNHVSHKETPHFANVIHQIKYGVSISDQQLKKSTYFHSRNNTINTREYRLAM